MSFGHLKWTYPTLGRVFTRQLMSSNKLSSSKSESRRSSMKIKFTMMIIQSHPDINHSSSYSLMQGMPQRFSDRFRPSLQTRQLLSWKMPNSLQFFIPSTSFRIRFFMVPMFNPDPSSALHTTEDGREKRKLEWTILKRMNPLADLFTFWPHPKTNSDTAVWVYMTWFVWKLHF